MLAKLPLLVGRMLSPEEQRLEEVVRVRIVLEPVRPAGVEVGRSLVADHHEVVVGVDDLQLRVEAPVGRTFSADTLRYSGLVARENSSDEVLETVKEVHALSVASIPVGDEPEDDIILRWRANLAFPYYYGNAQPSHYYLQKWQRDFLPGDREVPSLPKDASECANTVRHGS